VIIIGIRDVINTIIRYKILSKKNIPTSNSAKFKTIIQFAFILFILFLQVFSDNGTNPTTNAILNSFYIDIIIIIIVLINI
jgi:phosphatidylglycerophosphate synthase